MLIEIVRSRLGDALVATADDPCLEAWLAFQASAAGLSKSHPERWVINLDIGGGTTNIAVGKAGEVFRTGSLFVGARHVQFVPGTYRIAQAVRICPQAVRSFGDRPRSPAMCSTRPRSRRSSISISAARSSRDGRSKRLRRVHRVAASASLARAVRTFAIRSSRSLAAWASWFTTACAGKPLPSTTFFGDLGIDLAKRLLDSPRWSAHFAEFRAGLCGARDRVRFVAAHDADFGQHAVPVRSRDAPIAKPAHPRPRRSQIDSRANPRYSPTGRAKSARRMRAGRRGRRQRRWPPIGRENRGGPGGDRFSKRATVGAAGRGELSARRWVSMFLAGDQRRCKLMVLDEIAIRDARFVQIGGLRDQVVPVSFYGMN